MNLLFRTDASLAMGTGHVMRCLALAQACQNSGGRAMFALAQATPGIEAKLAAESCEMHPVSGAAGSEDDARQIVALARKSAAGWIVVDGYQFGAEYQRALKAAGLKVLVLDDYAHAAHYAADVVLNQNAYANEGMYGAREPYTRLLLGSSYCLLRREFASWRDRTRVIAPVGKKILVTMGGSDPVNFTAIVVEALHEFKDVKALVVVGGSNPHFDSLQVAAPSGDHVQFLRGAINMPELMAWADVAVAGAGTTCWEMCLLRLPMVLIDLAENQKAIARSLAERGAAVHVGTASSLTARDVVQELIRLLPSEPARAALSERCGALVDGRGTQRVFEELGRG